MSMIRSVPVLLLVPLLVAACQSNGNQPSASTDATTSTQGIKIVADTSVEATVRQIASTGWCGEGVSGYRIGASYIYRYENCDEVLETLEVAEVKRFDDSGNPVTAAFLRYSIGTKIFRDVIWFRKVGDRYATTTDHPRTYSTEEEWSQEAIKIAEEADNWEEESAEWYE